METIRLGLEWFLTPPHAPFLVGQEMGWFIEAGIDFEIASPDAHYDAGQALAEGRFELAVTEPHHLVRIHAEGRAVVGCARFFHTNGGVMYVKGGGIARPRDMAGKRVQDSAAPAPGGLAMVRTMIAADGGPKDAPLERVEMGFRLTDALIEGRADVATFAFYNFEVIEARARGLDADFFALKDWGVPDVCQLVLVASRRLLEERRDALARVVRILGRGVDFLHREPEGARAIFNRRAGVDPADALAAKIFGATAMCFPFDFAMTEVYYARLQRWMAETGQIARAGEPGAYWTNALV